LSKSQCIHETLRESLLQKRFALLGRETGYLNILELTFEVEQSLIICLLSTFHEVKAIEHMVNR
jgi:hypothetical protein